MPSLVDELEVYVSYVFSPVHRLARTTGSLANVSSPLDSMICFHEVSQGLRSVSLGTLCRLQPSRSTFVEQQLAHFVMVQLDQFGCDSKTGIPRFCSMDSLSNVFGRQGFFACICDVSGAEVDWFLQDSIFA